MTFATPPPLLVTTVKERCRVCYTCVRECPAKAIRITGSQAEVIGERCIGCGNCVRVCSQQAKVATSSLAAVEALLAGGAPVSACLAPSFPAEFAELSAPRLAGMLRAVGFTHVNEVAFGADLVAAAYRRMLADNPHRCYISTACPAIVAYVERYHPGLVEYLAPVVSPMVATARALHRIHGAGLRVVFIGPCVAKKGEEARGTGPAEVDEVLTFREVRELFRRRGVTPEGVAESAFDPPRGRLGTLFPVGRGMLQAAGIQEDLITGEVVAAEGRSAFVEVIKEFESGDLDLSARLLELLCCNGCTMGAGMSVDTPLFRRRALVSRFARTSLEGFDAARWQADVDALADLPLGRAFRPDDQRIPAPSGDEIASVMARMGKRTAQDELNCGACGYDTCREHAIAVCKALAESEMCLPSTIERLRRTVDELARSHEQLASAQQALMHTERLASMGQLAAGIAHEVNNPLGVVLLYAHMMLEACEASSPGRGDLEMIVSQADRCRKIVAGLLNFARQNRVLLQETEIAGLVTAGLRTVAIPPSVTLRVRHRTPGLTAELDRDQIIQVLANLLTNAVEAMPDGGLLTVSTGLSGEAVVVAVADTGTGIAPEHMNTIFEPFFTTKPMGKGTGLGLPVTYGIVKMHRGEIRVATNADHGAGPTGTEFTVVLPRRGAGEAAPGGAAGGI